MISKLEERIAGLEPWGSTPSGYNYSLRPNWIDLSLDFNSVPHKTDTAIIVTSWWGHLQFMRSTLTNYRKTGAFVILAYDFPCYSWDINFGFTRHFPPPNIMLLPHMFLLKHQTFDNPKREGWLWLFIYSGGIIKAFPHFKYILTVNSDCIWTKPEGLQDLKNELGSDDLMSVTSMKNNIHTCAVIYKREAFLKIHEYIADKQKVQILGSHSPEILLTEYVRNFGLKEKVAPIQPMEPDNSSIDFYSRYNQDSTWKQLVGYRNLGAEFLTNLVERTEPVPREYIDLDLLKIAAPGFSDGLAQYYKTGDRRWLYKAWNENEDSWYSRVYYPIEEYGEEPIYEIDPKGIFEVTRTIV